VHTIVVYMGVGTSLRLLYCILPYAPRLEGRELLDPNFRLRSRLRYV
jgi:hypothetical protein